MDDDASVHDKLLWAIHMSGMDDLLKFLASAQSEQQWSMHVLEIISLMFRDQVYPLICVQFQDLLSAFCFTKPKNVCF